MPINKIVDRNTSAAAVALKALHAYHRAVNLNGTAVELSDALAITDEQMRARYLAEIILRARSESAVAHALAPNPSANPRAIELHLYGEIRAALGHDAAVDVAKRVHALMQAATDAFLDGSGTLDPTDESAVDGTR
jgi:hypothetical protein